MFTIEADTAQRMIRVQMSGFLTPDEVADFSAQEQALIEAMGWRSHEFLLLIDGTDCVIQSQAVVSAFTGIVLASRNKAKRIAVARGSSLTRRQARRIVMVRDHAAVFETLAEAEAWLLAYAEGDRLRA